MTVSWDKCIRTAREVETRDPHTLEQKCRAAARWLSHDEDDWQSLIELIINIDAGRVWAIGTRVWTESEKEAWRDYMMNR